MSDFSATDFAALLPRKFSGEFCANTCEKLSPRSALAVEPIELSPLNSDGCPKSIGRVVTLFIIDSLIIKVKVMHFIKRPVMPLI